MLIMQQTILIPADLLCGVIQPISYVRRFALGTRTMSRRRRIFGEGRRVR